MGTSGDGGHTVLGRESKIRRGATPLRLMRFKAPPLAGDTFPYTLPRVLGHPARYLWCDAWREHLEATSGVASCHETARATRRAAASSKHHRAAPSLPQTLSRQEEPKVVPLPAQARLRPLAIQRAQGDCLNREALQTLRRHEFRRTPYFKRAPPHGFTSEFPLSLCYVDLIRGLRL